MVFSSSFDTSFSSPFDTYEYIYDSTYLGDMTSIGFQQGIAEARTDAILADGIEPIIDVNWARSDPPIYTGGFATDSLGLPTLSPTSSPDTPNNPTGISETQQMWDQWYGYLDNPIDTPATEENLINQDNVGQNIVGTNGDDYLTGGAGDDLIRGKSGMDLLCGLAGNDTLIGSRGVDIFFYSSPLEGVDIIKDFVRNQHDIISIQGQGFSDDLARGELQRNQFCLGSTATRDSHRFIYDQGELFFDPDGTGELAQIKIASFINSPRLKYMDILVV
jgi:hypothetical protein